VNPAAAAAAPLYILLPLLPLVVEKKNHQIKGKTRY
jgi:hypothetical protein